MGLGLRSLTLTPTRTLTRRAEVAAHLHLVMEGAARTRAVRGAPVAEARELGRAEVAPVLRHRLAAQAVHQPRGHLVGARLRDGLGVRVRVRIRVRVRVRVGVRVRVRVRVCWG